MTERGLARPGARAEPSRGPRRRVESAARAGHDERGGVAGVELVVEDGPRERRPSALVTARLSGPRAEAASRAQRQLLDGVGSTCVLPRFAAFRLMRAVACRAGTHPQRRLRGARRCAMAAPRRRCRRASTAQRVEHDDLVEPIQELAGTWRASCRTLRLISVSSAAPSASRRRRRRRRPARAALAASRVFVPGPVARARELAGVSRGRRLERGAATTAKSATESRMSCDPTLDVKRTMASRKSDRLTLAVGQDAVVEELEERVEDGGMPFSISSKRITQ